MFGELVALDIIDHTHNQQGRKAFKKLFTMAFIGFPDWYEAIEDSFLNAFRPC
jgi:predicted ester cyclase